MSTSTRKTGETGSLGLSSVLVASLPATLLTEAAPDRYTVEAIFTRRPDPDEVSAIIGEETRALLARSGRPEVTLAVSDRRLEISGTSLEQLRDGLAELLSVRLAEISAAVDSRRQEEAVRFQDAAEHEHERAAAVTALAESVTFGAPPAATRASTADVVAAGA